MPDQKAAPCTGCGSVYMRNRRSRTTLCLTCCEPARRAKISAAKADHGRIHWPTCRVWIRDCPVCSRAFVGRRANRIVCSDACARERVAEQSGCRDRTCADCSASLGRRSLLTYCDPCATRRNKASRRVQRAARRARERNAYIEPINPASIYERDGWRCGICRRRVSKTFAYPHPRSASLDHIVPLALGGLHERTNVQCSHLECNLAKRHHYAGQPLLVG